MYAAEINNGVVTRCIVSTSEWASNNLGGFWVESEHKVGIGWTYSNGEFRPPQLYPSWNWIDGFWVPPVDYPDDGKDYVWSEDSQNWEEFAF